MNGGQKYFTCFPDIAWKYLEAGEQYNGVLIRFHSFQDLPLNKGFHCLTIEKFSIILSLETCWIFLYGAQNNACWELRTYLEPGSLPVHKNRYKC